MVKQTITISRCEMKERVGKPSYLRCETSPEGWCSCFDSEVIKDLANPNHWNRPVSVDITVRENGQTWKNITKFHGVVAGEVASVPVVKPAEFVTETAPRKDKPSTTMYTSYAKDIFNTMSNTVKDWSNVDMTAIMNEAIKLVKQAREAFS